ncbi:MAG: 5'-methylthioadenosine/adenosylhomocysteine nucleosidase [Arcobacter butzleri]|jgi:adenosylhomocysteine/aminodeoxyfutalosine nucleosidase|nr:5'-methylthioadenosine/adenosylhomocysteine nucleosidase [Arcobacteraceae bacterium]MDY0364756.1 5'-methylthioadenosine/adenosylhomocysteine nucleosidase [Arcobacteraceae bacterium]NLO17730.1 5'-methylthioadenosine/adenosylhomocysteine nucleosidase [Aliarcobacter butzleri]
MAKIAIMGAMQEEVEPLLAYFDDIKITEYADNRYYEVKYNDLELVIAYSKIGKVFASLTASTMITKFGCEKLLFSGVAGAINPSLKIGDLVVATKLCQHDLDITAFGHPFGYVPEGKVFVESNLELIDIAREVAKAKGLNLLEGTIATGDQFVANETRKNWIGATFKADALEMEGASVAVVCDALDVPFLILRSISDSADVDAGFSFDEFLQSSALRSAEFLIEIIKRLK